MARLTQPVMWNDPARAPAIFPFDLEVGARFLGWRSTFRDGVGLTFTIRRAVPDSSTFKEPS
jgi:hypothetical protein